MKRLSIATALSLTTICAQAALLNVPAERLVPIYKGGMEAGLSGAYLKPTYQQNDFVIIDNSFGNNQQPNGKLKDLSEDYTFGYGFFVGWRFARSGNDARLKYFYLSSSVQCSESKQRDGQKLFTVVGQVNPTDYITTAQNARGKLEYELRRWDFEFAQHLNFCLRAHARFFFGAGYDCVTKRKNIRYIGDKASMADVDKFTQNKIESEFDGCGPRIGMDFTYAMNHGFGLVASISSALLYGQVCSETSIRRTDVDNINTSIKLEHHIVVPNIDLKVGVDYTYCLSNGHLLRAELAYWSSSYINAVNDTHYTGGAAFQADHINQLDSVSFTGGYLTGTFTL